MRTKAKAGAKLASGRERKKKIMVEARKIAEGGGALNFGDVLKKLDRDDATTLKLWATADDRDAIDRLCDKAREPLRRR